MKQLYLECYSGISGDMTVGALLDLGADKEKLLKVLETVPAQEFVTKISTVQKSGINACDFDVILDEDNHDHDMKYLFGEDVADVSEAGHTHEHHHDHDEHDDHHDDHHDGHEENGHDHGDETHEEHTHTHGHHHRNLEDVTKIIQGTQMSDEARELAIKIFTIVARAESRVHGKSINEVHFHEVGATDSIVDIISIAVCYEDLKEKEGFDGVIVPVLYEGTGTIRCQHGVLPVPVPAVVAISEEYGLQLHLIPDRGEFVTPTGAAAVAALCTGTQLPSEFKILKTGLGAGKRDYRRAGILRAMIIEG